MALSTVYRTTITFCDKFVPAKMRPLWEHPAGPKTVFFWSPLFKWVNNLKVALVLQTVHKPLDQFARALSWPASGTSTGPSRKWAWASAALSPQPVSSGRDTRWSSSRRTGRCSASTCSSAWQTSTKWSGYFCGSGSKKLWPSREALPTSD